MLLRRLRRRVYFCGGCQGDSGLRCSSGGVVDIAETVGAAGQGLAVDPVVNLAELTVGGKLMGKGRCRGHSDASVERIIVSVWLAPPPPGVGVAK